MNQEKKVSIIIPVYGTEKYIPRCLDSVLRQTYKNLEIIIVNDKSPDNSADIISKYTQLDNRIRVVNNVKNLGLFRARIEGYDVSTGDYISFLDSDDYIGIDYYRLLVKRMEETNSDIVVSRIVLDYENKCEKLVCNANNPSRHLYLENSEILDSFYNQEGQFYFWHTVWNKLYKREIMEKSRPHFEKVNTHIIMTEDLIYSSVIMYYARKITSIDYDGNFYVIRDDASTGTKINKKKIVKNLSDIAFALNFVDDFLKEKGLYEKYGRNFNAWKKLILKIWHLNIINNSPGNINLLNDFTEKINVNLDVINEVKTPIINNSHYCKWDERLELLRDMISDNKYEYISFDVFDTLVVRPFYKPTDLFTLMNEYYISLTGKPSYHKFDTMRIHSEYMVRKLNKSGEDVNLDEIYSQLANEYNIDPKVTELLKKREVELELELCKYRRTVKELYEMAQSIGKKIIIVSDMYLTSEVICKILNKNGYYGYRKVYVSSETGVAKCTGNMYNYVIKDLNIDPSKILHIGDTWQSDIEMSQKKGLHSYFIPKTIERLFNQVPDKVTGNSAQDFICHMGDKIDYMHALDFLMLRCMLGIVANEIFDNGYKSFDSSTNFNAEPEVMGYYALGMHVLSVTNWIANDLSEGNYEKIHFVARDGFIYKRVYDLIRKYITNLPPSNYLYISRKALLPTVAINKDNFKHIRDFLVITSLTPKSFLEKFYCQDISEKAIETLEKRKFALNRTFIDTADFNSFIDILDELYIDGTKLDQIYNITSEYLSENIGDHDVMFDIGYNGTALQLLANNKNSVDSYLIHTNWEKANYHSRVNNKILKTYYDYKPAITGHIREFLVSKTDPSCTGYEIIDNKVCPTFEKSDWSNYEFCIANDIQNSAFRFAEDFISLFGEYLPNMFVRNTDASMVLENFLAKPRLNDRIVFNYCGFSDENSNINKTRSLNDLWEEELNWHNMLGNGQNSYDGNNAVQVFLSNKNKFAKAMIYLLFDRRKFKDALKWRIKQKPCLFKFLLYMKGVLKN